MHTDVLICVSTTSWNTPDVAWVVGKAAMVCGYCWELRVLFGFCPKGFLTKCTLCIACVCMHTLLTQGMVLGIICTNHIWTCMDSCLSHSTWSSEAGTGEASKDALKCTCTFGMKIVDQAFLLLFCSRDSVSSSHRLDRARVEPVSLFKTNLNRCNVNVNLLLLSTGLLGNSAASGQ